MPIISADKFQYFRPTFRTEDVRGGFGAPGLPQVSQKASAANTQAGRELANQIQAWGQSIQERVIKEDVHQHTMAALAELTEAEIDVQTDPNHRTMPERFQERVKGIYDEHVQGISSDAGRRLFEEKFGLYSTNRQNRVQWRSYEREVGAQQASVDTSESNALLRISFSDNLSELQTVTQEFEADLRDKVRHGIVTEEWAEARLQEFQGKAGDLSVRMHLAADPQSTMTLLSSDDYQTYYPGLDPFKRMSHLKAAQTRVDQIEAQEIAERERQEREADELVEEAQEATYNDLQLALVEGRLTRPMLASAIRQRKIDPDKVNVLRNALDDQAEGVEAEENPYVKANLAEAVALGRDVRMDLDRARENGQIDGDTYVSLRRQAADQNYRSGAAYVDDALKLGMADKWSPDKNLRYAEAMDEYSALVQSGLAPEVASKQVVNNFMRDRRRSISGIPKPRLLQGDKQDLQALQNAMQQTVQKWQQGQMSPEVYQRETTRIEELMELARELEQSRAAIESNNADEDRLDRTRKANQ